VTRAWVIRAASAWPLVGLLFAARVHAGSEVSATSPQPMPAAVEVTVVGTADDLLWARSLVGRANAVLASARWRLRASFDRSELFASRARAHVLACWLNLSDRTRARLYFAAPSGERFLLREVALVGGGSEVDRASVAEVLELSVAALLENERAGLTRVETLSVLAELQGSEEPPVRRAPVSLADRPAIEAAPLETPSRILWGIGVSLVEQVLSTDLPIVQRFGGEVLAGRAYEAGWLAGIVSGEYQLLAEAQAADIGMQLQCLSVHAGIEAGLVHGEAAESRFGALRSGYVRLGLGIDFSHVVPLFGASAAGARLAPAHWSRALVFRGVIGTSWALASRLGLDARLLADLLPVGVHYDVAIEDERRAVFSLWRVRPGLVLALTWR